MSKQAKLSSLTTQEKVIVCVLLLAATTQAMGAAAVSPALPLMSKAFPSAAPTVIELVITLPNLCTAIFSVAIGAFADKVGKAVTLIVTSAIFTVSGCAAAFLNLLEPILVCRFCLGFGIAGITVAVTALISEIFHGAMRIRILSIQAAFNCVGIIILETSGGLLASFGWHIPFLVYLIGVPIFLGAVFLLYPTVKRRRREGTLYAAEDEAEESQAPRHEFSHKEVVVALVLASFTVGIMEFMAFVDVGKISYLVEALHGTTAYTGMLMGLVGVASTCTALLQPRVIRRVRRSTIMVGSFLCFTVGYVIFWKATALWPLAVGSFLVGWGEGLIVPTVLQWFAGFSTPTTSGKLMGVYTTVFNVSLVLGSVVLEPLQMLVGSLPNVFLVFGILALLVAVFMVLARKQVDHIPV